MEILATHPVPTLPVWQEPNYAHQDSGLITESLDYYKLTMSQFFHTHEPDVEATYTFHNRGTQRLLDHINPDRLQEYFDTVQSRGWTDAELQKLGKITINDGETAFEQDYLEYVASTPLPAVDVRYNPAIDDIEPRVVGPLPVATFWETVVMRAVSNQYFEGYMADHDIDPKQVWDDGDDILDTTIDQIKQDPTFKFLEFGTRRAFSPAWHRHVIERLANEVPDQLIGTSNVAYSELTSSDPKGTIAHEADMLYAALADARSEDIRASHGRMLDDWHDFYGPDYSIALTDTFTTDFFFADFGAERAEQWKGLRQDSGSPQAFGKKALEFYGSHGVDPAAKATIFSDGLDIPKALDLHQEFKGLLLDSEAIGTKLSHNVGLKPLNVVMKLTHVRDTVSGQEADTVKLSDDPGKHTGPAELVARYKQIFAV